jgi:hypothetical protein
MLTVMKNNRAARMACPNTVDAASVIAKDRMSSIYRSSS